MDILSICRKLFDKHLYHKIRATHFSLTVLAYLWNYSLRCKQLKSLLQDMEWMVRNMCVWLVNSCWLRVSYPSRCIYPSSCSWSKHLLQNCPCIYHLNFLKIIVHHLLQIFWYIYHFTGWKFGNILAR